MSAVLVPSLKYYELDFHHLFNKTSLISCETMELLIELLIVTVDSSNFSRKVHEKNDTIN